MSPWVKIVRVYRNLKSPGKSDFRDGGKRHHCHVLSISYLRESVSIDPGLLLGRGLIAPLETALLEAPIDTDGKAVRDLEKYDVHASGKDAKEL